MSLFASSAPSTVIASAKQANAAEWLKWCTQWRQLDDLLHGEHLEVTKSWAAVSHPNRSIEWGKANGQGYRFIDLVAMIADRLAVTFALPPETYLHRGDGTALPETDPQVRQWRADEKHLKLSELLQDLESRLVVLRQLAVSPSWINGKISWKVYAPYELAVEPDPADPSELTLARTVALEVRDYGAGGGTAYPSWLKWTYNGTAWGYEWVDNGGQPRKTSGPTLFADGVNGYGRHPVVLWRYRQPRNGDVFVAPDEPLLHIAVGVNIAITDLFWGLKYQVHPQGVEYGKSKDSSPLFGPDTVRRYNSKSEEGFEFVTPDLNVAEYRESIEWALRMHTVALGLPPDTFSPNSSTRNLGAKQEEAHQLHIRRRKKQPTLVDYLQQTFDAHRAVGNYWADKGEPREKFDDDLQLGVYLMPVPQVTDRAQGVQATQSEQAENLTSPVEREMLASGSTREAAAARIEQRKAENERFSSGAAAPP